MTVVWIVIAVLGIAAILFGAYRRFGGGAGLRSRFGDEYDRLVAEKGNRSAAEAELRRRLKDHGALRLKDVTEDERSRYREGWRAVQKQFVDDPVTAVRTADQMVVHFVTERGYPEADFGRRVELLSVEHARVLDHYRTAHDISVGNDAGRATTEDLRQALVRYRELLADMIGADLSNGWVDAQLPVVAPRPTAAPAVPPARTGTDAIASPGSGSEVDTERAMPAETDAERADHEHPE